VRWDRPFRPFGPKPLPVARQYDRTDCGPAALLSVLRGWGGDAGLAEVRDLAGTDVRGTTLLGLLHAARRLGMEARGVRANLRELERQPLPCLVLLTLPEGSTHYVVVDRIGQDAVWIRDPASGRIRMPRSEFERLWRSGAALLLEPTSDLRSSPQTGWIRWFSGTLREDRTWLLQSIFLGCIGTGLGLGIAIFVQVLVDRLIPEGDSRLILLSGLALLGILTVRAASNLLRHRILLGLGRRVGLRMHDTLLRHLFRLPVRFFERRAVGDIAARMDDGLRIQHAITHVLGTCVIDGIIVAGSLVFLFVLVPPLGWIALGTIPLFGVVLLRVASRLEAEEKAVRSAHARVRATQLDTLAGVAEILSLGVAPLFIHLNSTLHDHLQLRIERLGWTRAGLSLVVEVCGSLLVLGALVGGALLVVDGTLHLGQLVAGYALLGGILPSVERLVLSLLVFQEASVAAHRARDLVLSPPEPSGGTRAFRLERTLELEGVGFEWVGGPRLLDGVDLELPVGRITGLTGPNGVGKSTLVRILGRSLEPTSGRVLIDGRSAGAFSLADHRRQVAVFPRDVRIFSGTLAHNVLLGRGEGSALPHLEREIGPELTRLANSLPEGWATRIGEGGHRLSSGERQMVGLMRALAGRPRALLVDEGIVSADAQHSRILMAVVRSFAARASVLLVSHETSILLEADHLFLLEGGRIVRDGPPHELLAAAPSGFPLRAGSGPLDPGKTERGRRFEESDAHPL